MSGVSNAAGSVLDTCRVSRARLDQDTRAQFRALALRAIQQLGAEDLAPMLGLVDTPTARRSGQLTPHRPLPPRPCEVCGDMYRPRDEAQRACGRSCGGVLGGRTRAAAANRGR